MYNTHLLREIVLMIFINKMNRKYEWPGILTDNTNYKKLTITCKNIQRLLRQKNNLTHSGYTVSTWWSGITGYGPSRMLKRFTFRRDKKRRTCGELYSSMSRKDRAHELNMGDWCQSPGDWHIAISPADTFQI